MGSRVVSAVPDLLLTFYTGMIGLMIGSYINVVAHRLPRRESTVRPRSRCPVCGAPVRARDNVPILSYLLLGGRCRDCGVTISFRYPVVEGVTGILFALCYLRFGLEPATLVAALFVALLIALGLIDFDHFLLPDRITYPGIILGLLLSPLAVWTNPLSSLVGAVVGAGVLLALIGLWYLLRGQLGMGLGDPKMMAMIGAFLGLPGMLVCLLLASLIGSALSLFLIARGSADLQTKLPFGVYLSIAGLITLFAGPSLVRWYGGLLY